MVVKSESNRQFIIFIAYFLLIFTFSLSALNSFSQVVDINTTGYEEDFLAMLDVRSTNGKTGNVPKPGSITGNTSVSCSATGVVYSIGLVPTATGYTWTVPTGAIVATGQGSPNVTVNFGSTNGSVCVTAENACGTSSASCISITVTGCGPQCGSQIWAATNLELGLSSTVTEGTNQTSGQEWCYNNIYANCTTYGGLYQWADAMNISNIYNSAYATATLGITNETCNPCSPTHGFGGVRGICPSGYHIPSDLEWSQYEYCIENTISPTGNTALGTFQNSSSWRGSTNAGVGPGDKMKTSGTGSPPLWSSGTGSNTSGFAALPGGYSNGASGSSLGTNTYFWSAKENGTTSSWMRELESSSAQSYRWGGVNYANKGTKGLSVRCLKDICYVPISVTATASPNPICIGNSLTLDRIRCGRHKLGMVGTERIYFHIAKLDALDNAGQCRAEFIQ